MHTFVRIFCLAVGLMVPSLAHPASLTVTDSDIVRPDPELLATVVALRAVAATAKKANIKKVEAFFALEVKTFQRSLDPFQPWNPTDALTRKYLQGVADVMVEQGELAAGMPVPDYRVAAMEQMADMLKDANFGSLPEVPGAVCVPAAYKVDRKTALAFAKRFELDAYSLQFFSEDVVLKKRPGSAAAGISVPPRTLMMSDYHPHAPEGWSFYETVEGIRGYMENGPEALGLSQNHVCFSKVKGKYKITAVFGYGL